MDMALDASSKNMDFDSAWANFMKEQSFMPDNCATENKNNQNENLLNHEESNAFSKFLDSLMNEQTQPKEIVRKLDEELNRLNSSLESVDPKVHNGIAADIDEIEEMENTARNRGNAEVINNRMINGVDTSNMGVNNLDMSHLDGNSNVAVSSMDIHSVNVNRNDQHPLQYTAIRRSPSPLEYLSQSETMIKTQMDNYQAAYSYVPDPQTFYPPPSYYPHHLSMYKVQQIPSLQMNYQQLYQQLLPVYNAVPDIPIPQETQTNTATNQSRKRKRSDTEEMSRINHVNSEKKRRAHIKERYQDMCDLVPEVRHSAAKFPKSHVLKATLERLISLAEENKRIRNKIEACGVSTVSIREIHLQPNHMLSSGSGSGSD